MAENERGADPPLPPPAEGPEDALQLVALPPAAEPEDRLQLVAVTPPSAKKRKIQLTLCSALQKSGS